MITNWADPLLKYFAETSGIPKEEYVPMVIGEGYGSGIEFATDFFTTVLGSKVIQGIIGIALGSYAIWGKDVDKRLRRELIAVANHEVFRLVDPSPTEIYELQRNIADLTAGIVQKNAGKIWGAFIRPPQEYMPLVMPPAPPIEPKPVQI